MKIWWTECGCGYSHFMSLMFDGIRWISWIHLLLVKFSIKYEIEIFLTQPGQLCRAHGIEVKHKILSETRPKKNYRQPTNILYQPGIFFNRTSNPNRCTCPKLEIIREFSWPNQKENVNHQTSKIEPYPTRNPDQIPVGRFQMKSDVNRAEINIASPGNGSWKLSNTYPADFRFVSVRTVTKRWPMNTRFTAISKLIIRLRKVRQSRHLRNN